MHALGARAPFHQGWTLVQGAWVGLSFQLRATLTTMDLMLYLRRESGSVNRGCE